ncbi:hypothetical protein ACIBLB_35695 [Streptosporangium canum]|uniref:hypothetical protein n=1 Tax=Streptosporangium canum TaxID=324952 RepID=UPI00378AADAA
MTIRPLAMQVHGQWFFDPSYGAIDQTPRAIISAFATCGSLRCMVVPFLLSTLLSRNAIKKALDMLKGKGLVETAPDRGFFVN